MPKTVTFDEVTSRFYRVMLPNGGTVYWRPPQSYGHSTGGQQSPWVVPVDDLQLLQKGEAIRQVAQPGVRAVRPSTLPIKWTPPDTSRGLSLPGTGHCFGSARQFMTAVGWEKLTKTSSPGAQGYEIDIMSTEALDAQIAETAEKLASDIGPLAGKTLKYLHIDSWEGGEPNWTTHMVEEFKKRRGYDPMPYLAMLSGTIGRQSRCIRPVCPRFAAHRRRLMGRQPLWPFP